ncbi:site-specific DNA-methyltransferase [Tenacibaculum aquimarinum]|uniref:site-specific DNA-methyltransferase n=1 Tax=Tenacibaculum aquimarinum TaxID=2910675 RepID=UPI001F0B2A58|nr:site-specific DNA-methyltransferase [Tenacibaculum aquimarinum]MCH3885679.1 site-specific DNA-methyltransferase [Tenacibaculum aquimarinum]
MNKKQQKLELTWIGKGEEPSLEPRILIENPEYSYGDPGSENLLIHGDNLLALKALEQDYAGKVKCIYIDPPYNTGKAFEYYDDNLEHSIWLDLMSQRIKLLHKLLSDDGFMFLQIDDQEMAYASVLMDEIFGRNNRINIISVNMSSLSGVKMTSAINGKRFPKSKEFILLYAKKKGIGKLRIPKVPKDKWDKEYNMIIPKISEGQFSSFNNLNENEVNKILKPLQILSLTNYAKEKGIKLSEEWKKDNSYRIFGTKSNTSLVKSLKGKSFQQQVVCYTNTEGNNRFFISDYNKSAKDPRIELVQAEANSSVFLSDNWLDISNDGGIGQEGSVHFPNGKKPEKLISRIIYSSTVSMDLVLDSFLGSGTTSAVAQKMGRKYIGIEMGDHAYTHCYPRQKMVTDGEDQGGITKLVNWQGGGGFKFYELAPSLLNKDKYDNWVISKEYNPAMLAAAMAKQEGFSYAPNKETYWKQGYSAEQDFIFTTTQFVTVELLDQLKDQLKEGESLLICAKKFHPECNNKFKNIVLKKIPKMLLGKCEFGKDDYSLNIINPPVLTEEELGDE